MPKYKKDADIPLPSLKGDETNPPSSGRRQYYEIPKEGSRPLSPENMPHSVTPGGNVLPATPSTELKRGGAVKRYDDGGPVAEDKAPTGSFPHIGRSSGSFPNIDKAYNLKTPPKPQKYFPSTGQQHEPSMMAAKGGPIGKGNSNTRGYKKGGSVEHSTEDSFKANIVDAVASPPTRTKFSKGGGVVKGNPPAGHGWRRWGHGK